MSKEMPQNFCSNYSIQFKYDGVTRRSKAKDYLYKLCCYAQQNLNEDVWKTPSVR